MKIKAKRYLLTLETGIGDTLWAQPRSVPRHGVGSAYGARRPSALGRHSVHMPFDVAACERALVTDPARAQQKGLVSPMLGNRIKRNLLELLKEGKVGKEA